MVIAVIAVGMMEMSGDQVVDVIAVGNRLVAAVRPVNVSRFVAVALVTGRTSVRIVLALRRPNASWHCHFPGGRGSRRADSQDVRRV